jgi:ABC-type lipoprotein export system ATPase subunit
VHDCSLTVAEGEILVLMGLSGSGKSTLLRGVNALNPVVRGEVRVLDDDKMVSVTKANAETLRRLRATRIAMVFQQFGLLPWRTVRENVGPRAGTGRHVARGAQTRGRRPAGAGEPERNGPSARWANCRAACSSASAWPAPLSPTRRSF